MTSAAAAPDPAVNPSLTGSVDPAEIAKFSALAESWWDPAGKFRTLHRLNPVRLGYIRDRAAARLGREAQTPRSLAGLSLVDIGCGGVLISQHLPPMGAAATDLAAPPGTAPTEAQRGSKLAT
jgi:2-polyprenyl-6-hydroxyphenyl methylase/3-demethylubiquinone-9 3-methyltransferase